MALYYFFQQLIYRRTEFRLRRWPNYSAFSYKT